MLTQRRATKVSRDADPYARPDVPDRIWMQAKRDGSSYVLTVEATQYAEYAKVPLKVAGGPPRLRLVPIKDLPMWKGGRRWRPNSRPTIVGLLNEVALQLSELALAHFQEIDAAAENLPGLDRP